MSTPSFLKRIAALEASSPEHGPRVVHRREDLRWTPEQRAFLAGLPRHRGLTVVVRRFSYAQDSEATL